MQELLVAAGGGGDAIAAYMLATRFTSARPTIATWAWDRLMIDPLPGPRSASDFERLDNPSPGVHIITAITKPVPPAGSTIPRLASDLDADLVLLDPAEGCVGLARQIAAAAEWADAEGVVVLDVGGDAIARRGDAGLRSPMADISTLVAVSATGLPARLVVVGAGCDGELAPELVERRLKSIGAYSLAPVSSSETDRVISILRWHPSEATALVVMAALGHRGQVEIRDQGLPVPLTDTTASVHEMSLTAALPADEVTDRIRATTSLAALEEAFRETFQISEIDYERRKAQTLDKGSPPPRVDVALFLAQAAERGTQWVTRRRLREAAGTVPTDRLDNLLIPTA